MMLPAAVGENRELIACERLSVVALMEAQGKGVKSIDDDSFIFCSSCVYTKRLVKTGVLWARKVLSDESKYWSRVA